VHELGHFIFARLFNVRCDVFSLGFGPKIFRKKIGETEYCLSVVPLGGYVKLLGQDPNEQIPQDQIHRTLNYQDPWKRFLVYFGGPLFNFIFALFIFVVLMILGDPYIPSKIEYVAPNTKAYELGFRSQDQIVSINHTPVNKLEEVMNMIGQSLNKEILIRVKRGESFKDIYATPTPTLGMSIYGEMTTIGTIEGLFTPLKYPVIAVTSDKSLAAKANLKTGNVIISFNDKEVHSFEELEAMIDEALNSKNKLTSWKFGILSYTLDDWKNDKKIDVKLSPDKIVELPARRLQELGIESTEMIVQGVLKNSPAETAGIKTGDRILSINGEKLQSFSAFKDKVQELGQKNQKIKITIEREGKNLTFDLTPIVQERKGMIGESQKQFLIGVYPLFVQAEPKMLIERIYNPFILAKESWARSIDITIQTMVSIKKLLFREVPMQALGGPLMIGKIAGDSFERGLAHFLKVMALISISLCVFNLIPIPILDGGYILLLLFEVLRGKPISIRQSELVQQVGVTLILLLLVIVMFNDISRVGIPALTKIFE
jgi:regulator of sigma E protease